MVRRSDKTPGTPRNTSSGAVKVSDRPSDTRPTRPTLQIAKLRPFSAWHPDLGDVLWWSLPVGSARPHAGSPDLSGWPWIETEHQNLWWAPLPEPVPILRSWYNILNWKLKATPNSRQHHMTRARVRKEDRAFARELLADYSPPERGRIFVHLVRVAPRALDSHDNLPGACKGIVDGITEALGFADDSHRRLVFHYDQRKGPPKTYLVELLIDEEVV